MTKEPSTRFDVEESTSIDGAPVDLVSAFWRYDRALLANDLDELDLLFVRADDTVRVGPSGSLVGWSAIADFRRERPTRATRTITHVHATRLDEDCYVLVAGTSTPDRGPGAQTQVWQRTVTGWQVRAAHVSGTPAPTDAATWRVRARPLVPATRDGELARETVAVKDLFAVAGHRTGGGVPSMLMEAEPAADHADAVASLLAAGASVVGITQCDEFAYGLEGTNPHSGTSRNAAAPTRIPGGSSSGSASAVASGDASIGLATDTAGSVRVPASYQGLWGLRTTHGIVSMRGALALAPSFDAVGWLTRSPELLIRILDALELGSADLGSFCTAGMSSLVVDASLTSLASARTRSAFSEAVALDVEPVDIIPAPDMFESWFTSLRARQAFEAWRQRGDWIAAHPGALSPAVEARFRAGEAIDAITAGAALDEILGARAHIIEALDDRILVAPTAFDAAPLIGTSEASHRDATLRLGSIAAIAGLPALSAPLLSIDDLPLGITLFAAPGRERSLLDAAIRLRACIEHGEATDAQAA